MKIKSLLLLVLMLLTANTIYAEQHINLTATADKSSVKAGETFNVHVSIKIDDGWYTYDFTEQLSADFVGPTTSELALLPKENAELAGKLKTTKPKSKYDKGFEMDVKYFKHTIEVDMPMKALKDLDFSSGAYQIEFYAQLCTDEKCLPAEPFLTTLKPGQMQSAQPDNSANEIEEQVEPATEEPEDIAAETEVTTTDNIEESSPAESGEQEIKSESQKMLEESQSEGIFSFIWLAMTYGAISLLMPCVFPMIPITVSFFTQRAQEKKGSGLGDALLYAGGIIFTFTSLGLIFSLIIGPTGIQEFAKLPGVYLAIAGIFIFFAFNLFGAYEIQMPTGLMNKLNIKSQQGGGVFSVLLMGLTFSLASFSCTGPFVGAVLVTTATGEWFYPIIGMLAFSTVLSAPFFLLALFPSAMAKMPRAGGWMNNVKVVMGFVVIATSLYFINNAFTQWGIEFLSREIFLGIWVAAFLLISTYILGIWKTNHDAPVDSVGIMRMTLALIFLSLTFYFMSGLFGSNLGEVESYLPQSEQQQTVTATSSHSEWLTDLDEAKAKAIAENKPLFIDFTGKTCTNCKKMERTMFPKGEISSRLDQMVKVKLITDVRGEPYESNKKYQLETFKTVEIPMYVVMLPDGKVTGTKAFTRDVQEFTDFLDKGLK